jgi:hypothetical protein
MLCNYLSIENYCLYEEEKTAIVITSSGPSLQKSLPQLRQYRKKFRLWALPSSLLALKKYGLVPDLIVSTDPGYYASYHLQYSPRKIPVAIPLTGSRGLWKDNRTLMILNQSFPFEKDLFSMGKIPNMIIPSNGTVSGTALELAQKYSGTIYFTGLDLCYSDIKSHVSPHSFDTLLHSQSDRNNPLQNIYFNRASAAVPDFSSGIRTSTSLDTYKNWFNSKCSSISVKRVHPSPVRIDNMSIGNLEELNSLSDLSEQRYITYKAEDKKIRKVRILQLLNSWEEDLSSDQNKELLYFIDTDSYSRGIKNNKALDFIREMRRIYA